MSDKAKDKNFTKNKVKKQYINLYIIYVSGKK